MTMRLGSFAVAFAALIVGCHHRSGSNPPSMLRGIVAVTGTSFEQRIELQRGTETTPVTASAADSAALVRLAGVEVETRGWLEQRVMRVASFTAWSVNGAPVIDGIVRVDGRNVTLETPKGTVSLGNPPDALRIMAGARVWVGGPTDRGPNTFGVIVPAR